MNCEHKYDKTYIFSLSCIGQTAANLRCFLCNREYCYRLNCSANKHNFKLCSWIFVCSVVRYRAEAMNKYPPAFLRELYESAHQTVRGDCNTVCWLHSIPKRRTIFSMRTARAKERRVCQWQRAHSCLCMYVCIFCSWYVCTTAVRRASAFFGKHQHTQTEHVPHVLCDPH